MHASSQRIICCIYIALPKVIMCYKSTLHNSLKKCKLYILPETYKLHVRTVQGLYDLNDLNIPSIIGCL